MFLETRGLSSGRVGVKVLDVRPQLYHRGLDTRSELLDRKMVRWKEMKQRPAS